MYHFPDAIASMLVYEVYTFRRYSLFLMLLPPEAAPFQCYSYWCAYYSTVAATCCAILFHEKAGFSAEKSPLKHAHNLLEFGPWFCCLLILHSPDAASSLYLASPMMLPFDAVPSVGLAASNVKSSIVEERMHSIFFVPWIVLPFWDECISFASFIDGWGTKTLLCLCSFDSLGMNKIHFFFITSIVEGWIY